MKLKQLFLEDKEDSIISKNSFSAIKKLSFFLMGLFGMSVVSLVCICLFQYFSDLSIEQQRGLSTFITYSILAVVLLAIIGTDYKIFNKEFSKIRFCLIGILFGAVILGFSIAYSNLINLFYPIEINNNEKILRGFISIFPIPSILVLGIIGPFCEELTYRVGLFGFLKKNKIVAYVVSVLVFALMHFDITNPNIANELINLPSYLFSAFMFTYAYDKFGLFCSLSAHWVNNLFAVTSIVISTLL